MGLSTKPSGGALKVPGALLTIVCIFAGNAKAAPSRASEPAAKLDTPSAAVLWHEQMKKAVPDAELLAMFNVRLDGYDEFSRRKVFRTVKRDLARRETQAKHNRDYSLTVQRPVGEYDFGRKGFPIDVPTGRIGLPAGEYQYPSSTCQGFTSDTAVYRAWVESPDEISFLPVGESAAEKMMPRFQRQRIVEVEFILRPQSAVEERAGMSDEGGSMMSCNLIRDLQFTVHEVRIALPALEKNYGGNGAPRRILKVWKF